MEFQIGVLKEIDHAMSNKVYLHPADYDEFLKRSQRAPIVYGKIQYGVFIIAPVNYLERGFIGLSRKHREFLKLSQALDKVRLEPFQLPQTEYRAGTMRFEIVPVVGDTPRELSSELFTKLYQQLFINHFFGKGQEVLFDLEGVQYFGKLIEFGLMESGVKRVDLPFAMIFPETEFQFNSKQGSKLNIKNKSNVSRSIFKQDFKFEDMGVGGLDAQIANIFRRAFSSRRMPNHILEKYGIKHIKGMILYGPPGTGKTLIARQLAKVLHAKEPKIVNGPELFNKFVGETEANVRKLFDDAKADMVNLKDESPLHVIIFDEFDSIAKHRGADSSGTGVADNIVNQLLSMIDGVEALENILVIGMTNRLDLIDRAVLRPGRFEVHVEIGLPDEDGRVQIFKIHTKTMVQNKLLGADVDLREMAQLTKNYTGAEIEAVVKSASSFAINRHNNLMDFSKKITIDNAGPMEKRDFMQALTEVQPEFGVQTNRVVVTGEFIKYGSRLTKIGQDMMKTIEQIKTNNIPLASILLYGAAGTGLSTIANTACITSQVPFVKVVLPDDFMGKSESYKVNFLVRAFEDAYKSKQSIILIDDLDRMLEYIEVGKRFNNNLLGAFLVLIKKRPTKLENSLAIICTCSNVSFLHEFKIFNEFNVKIRVPELSFNYIGENEIGAVASNVLGVKVNGTIGQKPTFKIGIKKLIFILNIIKKQLSSAKLDDLFREALQMSGYEDRDDDLTALTDRIDMNLRSDGGL